MQSNAKEKNVALDIIRIIAILAVVLLHMSGNYVLGYDISTAEYLSANILDSLSRIGVPLFLMVSGALMLDERRSVSMDSVLRKNVKSVAILTVLWSLIYAVVFAVLFPLWWGQTPSIGGFISEAVKGPFHIWYLYMIIGLYLATPFLRAFVKKDDPRLARSFLIIALASQFLLPVIAMLCRLNNGFACLSQLIERLHLHFFGGYVAYYLLGWYMVHVGMRKAGRIALYLLGLAGAVFIFVYAQLTGDFNTVYGELGLPVFFYSTAVFSILSSLKPSFSEKTSARIGSLSRMTFGVYLIHPLVQRVLREILSYNGSMPALHILLSFVIVSLLSFIACWVMSKIPVIRKLVRM